MKITKEDIELLICPVLGYKSIKIIEESEEEIILQVELLGIKGLQTIQAHEEASQERGDC